MAQIRSEGFGFLSMFHSIYQTALPNPNQISGEIVHCDVHPGERTTPDLPPPQPHGGNPADLPEFLIEITAKFAPRPAAPVPVPGRIAINVSGSFRTCLHTAPQDVLRMLACVHVPRHMPGVGPAADKVVVCIRQLASAGPSPVRAFRVTVKLEVLVGELPPYGRDHGGLGLPDLGGGGAHDVRFEPASEGAIAGLERVRGSEKECCAVCLEDISVGSEATRLPCSHLFHGDCIVKWLHNSKICPVCRFELPL